MGSEAAASSPHAPPPADSYDHRVVLHGVSWAEYEAVLAIRGESSGVRMTYLEGELELMSPSLDHEGIKKLLARLLQAYAEERDLDLNGYGSWTVKSEPRARGIEPDECYVLGTHRPDVPDLAIEVVWSHWQVDKLDVYAGLGIPEVWLWQAGSIRILVLAGERYREQQRSRLLPELDLEQLAGFIREEASQTRAVRKYRAWLREHAR